MSAPHHNDGPFVNDSRGPGLLRRLLGGGTNDPTSPHDHNFETSTSQMHDRPLRPTPRTTPVAPPSPFGIPRSVSVDPYEDSSAGTRTGGAGMLMSILSWLFRHPRVAMTLLVGIVALSGVFSESSGRLNQVTEDLQQIDDGFDYTSPPATPAPAPAPAVVDPTAPRAATTPDFNAAIPARIFDLRGNDVTIEVTNNTKFNWKVNSPRVRASLAANLGQDVMLDWEVRDGGVYVIGVDGPNGTFAAPEGQ